MADLRDDWSAPSSSSEPCYYVVAQRGKLDEVQVEADAATGEADRSASEATDERRQSSDGPSCYDDLVRGACQQVPELGRAVS